MPANLGKVSITYDDIEERKAELKKEIADSPEAANSRRNVLINFLAECGVRHIYEMDYNLREEFREYLLGTRGTRTDLVFIYITMFDRIKQYSIQQESRTLAGSLRGKWQYRNEIMFIPYHSDPNVIQKFSTVRYSSNMVWDFRVTCSEKIKRQIFTVLDHIIENYEATRLREYRLTGLQYLYEFCIYEEVDDLEMQEKEFEHKFQEYLAVKKLSDSRISRLVPILDYARKIIFESAKEIHWNANIWYLDRFHFIAERVNPSKKIERISFYEVTYLPNRNLLKEYMRYGLGVTDMAISTIYEKFKDIRSFLAVLSEETQNVTDCTVDIMDAYFRRLEQEETGIKTYNSKVMNLHHFFKFLEIKKYIKKVPFYIAYYIKKDIPVHHDRSVESDVYMEIIRNLKCFPEHLRLMYLHLWSLGLRISEVCTLKGNAYYIQGDDAWIQVYQVKMKNYKRIPISRALYDLMKIYIRKHGIGQADYIFQNRKGGAFAYGTFTWQMKKWCNKCHINVGQYLFRSHDYRHTLATGMYDNGVPKETIRDYLGHIYEEMTMQYIDYMPKRIAEKNDEYFANEKNSLASGIMKGVQDEKKNLLSGTGVLRKSNRRGKEETE